MRKVACDFAGITAGYTYAVPCNVPELSGCGRGASSGMHRAGSSCLKGAAASLRASVPVHGRWQRVQEHPQAAAPASWICMRNEAPAEQVAGGLMACLRGTLGSNK